MKYMLLICLAGTFVAQAQTPAVVELANAERAFAQRSVDVSIRSAFLENFDDKTIAFVQGEPALGRPGWEKRPEGNGYLFWWPVVAEVASSGDWGYTTGPAVFGPNRTTKLAKGGIYYASVWKKNDQGVWKVVADLGSATYDTAEHITTFREPNNRPKKRKGDHAKIVKDFFGFDQSYIAELNKASVSYIPKFFDVDARVHRPGQTPTMDPSKVGPADTDRKFAFEQVGGEVAPSNDLAYTYGKVKVTSMKDGKEALASLCYMRVWKFESGAWRIVLDVIG